MLERQRMNEVLQDPSKQEATAIPPSEIARELQSLRAALGGLEKTAELFVEELKSVLRLPPPTGDTVEEAAEAPSSVLGKALNSLAMQATDIHRHLANTSARLAL